MKWFFAYFFVTSQIYPDPTLTATAFINDHARETCSNYRGALYDEVVEIRRSGKQHGRRGYVYVARCYRYDFSQPRY